MVCMKTYKYKSDGLCGFLRVSATLVLGSKKHILANKFYLCIIAFVLTMLHSNYSHSCLSFILALQRNNDSEVHKNLKRPYRHVTHTPTSILLFSRNLLLIHTVTVFSTWLFCLIMLCGDVELIPGPDSVDGSTVSSLNSTVTKFN